MEERGTIILSSNTVSAAQDVQASDTSQPLIQRFCEVQALSEQLCQPLLIEDYVVTPTPDIGSPVKWHLAHTSWFFETLVLLPHLAGYRAFHPQYSFFFNSYYVQLGQKQDRTQRGFISRPTVDEVYAYRRHVNEALLGLIDSASTALWSKIAPIITVGLHHEQQHQELILSDIKHVFWNNPLRPVYKERTPPPLGQGQAPALRWCPYPEGVYWIGHEGTGFAYDNEYARHRQFVAAFELASRPVTNGEYQAFVEDGGYRQSSLWLDAGWDTIQDEGWACPFYWERCDDGWHQMTLAGMQPLDPDEPVCHLSYFEADAYARWVGARLPSEAEWELAARERPVEGNFVESGVYHPLSLQADAGSGLQQAFGDVWEWTNSHYSPYPGYEAPPGALGEYNGKFMCGKFVLRGGSCATPQKHVRPTYRNFFSPQVRWAFSGLRLARSR